MRRLKLNKSYFQNPVLDDNVADPTIWEDNGTYYLFYTGCFSFPIYKSNDLINWKCTNKSPFDESTIEQLTKLANKYESQYVIYAPTVVKVGDKYNMYISITWKCMCVLQSGTAEGPFKFVGEPYVLVDDKITGLNVTFEDSCVVCENNQWYLIWGSHGQIIRTKLTNDGLRLKEPKKFKHIAGCKYWPCKMYEGAYIYYRNGYWYLFCAKGDYTSSTDPYGVVVGRSKHLYGVFRTKCGLPMTWGIATNILKPTLEDGYLGGGHTGEIFSDKNGRTYIFYQRQKEGKLHYRPLFLQEIFWDRKGWPYFEDDETKIYGRKPNL